ncbi:uncharacterized protein LOC116308113 [Actinia tenebrosa]|uniref:Uncharacterized protein LOC116308113 n=1 Tax=Actinia tenebrosa TaxID=6105 RepID=A0A6P8J305_ACTTE|nr:uncharacterized protein LOC116308113 [Actinia tenebrosa]
MVEELVKEKLPKSKLDDLMSKYLRPENCKLLVNRAVWNQLSQNTKATDRAFQKSQQYFITAMYAMMSACEKATGEMKSVLAHSLVLALAGNRELNLRRWESLRPELNSQFASLCNPTTPITDQLFGDDIGKEIDEVNKANRLSKKMSSKRGSRKGYHPYNSQSRQRSSSSSRDGRAYGSRSFLGERGSYRRRGGARQCFVIHLSMSIFNPTQSLEFLGFVLNSDTMTVCFTPRKIEKIVLMCQKYLCGQAYTIREVASLIGTLVSTFSGVEFGPLYYRNLE